jgi:Reverse transcriptase (RNA-dependent DNA polymerase)
LVVNIGGLYVSIWTYADDIVLVATSSHALQQLLDNVMANSAEMDMEVNARKTICTVFSPKNRSFIVLPDFPPVYIGRDRIQFVPNVKFLGQNFEY